LKKRQSEDRPRIIEHIAEARSHGDLSENAEYHAAKEEQSHNEGRIAELEDKLARADIIDISKLSGDTVKFGATVTLVDEDTEKKAGVADRRRAGRPTPRRAVSRSPRRWPVP
jgi:transcription elongation factor GreA